MNGVEADTAASVAGRLRSDFDRSFAAAPTAAVADRIGFLAIRLGNDPYVIRLTETAGLFADRRVTPLPSPAPTMRGIAGIRGTIVPVHDLAGLLGYPLAAAPRWLVIASEAQIAFGFEAFDGQILVDRADIAIHAGTSSRQHASEIAEIGDGARPIVNLHSLIDALRRQLPPSAAIKEQ